MELGALLVLLGIILAVISYFVPDRRHALIVAAIVLLGVGVLVGVGDGFITTD